MRNVIVIPLLLAATTGVSATAAPQVSDDAGMRPALVGGDRDEHGCIGSAGYSWDAENAKCVRPWENEFGSPFVVKAKSFNFKFRISVFGFLSDFDIRASGFTLLAVPAAR